MSTRRLLVPILGIFLLILAKPAPAFAKATVDKSASSFAKATEDKKETVVFWFGATSDERKTYENLIAEFNRIHKNIEVKPMLTPQTYIERKLLLSVAGRVPPDVVRFYTHLGGELMSRGGLEPLDDLIKRDGIDLDDFYPVSVKQNTYGGKLYGMPWVLSPYALFYNKQAFRDAGLDPNRPPRTWKELEYYARKLTKRDKDGRLVRVGYADFLNNPTNFSLYLWQSGGELLTPDLKKPAFDSPQGREALQWMRDFLIKEVGDPKLASDPARQASSAITDLRSFTSQFTGAAMDPFGQGAVAMRIDSPFRIPDLKTYFPNLDYGVSTVPYNRVRTLEVVGNSLVIPKGSKHKEAAWEFIKFATSREQLIKISKAAGRLPARKSAAMAPEYQRDPILRAFIAEIPYGRSVPVAPGYREAGDAIARNMEPYMKGDLTAEEALSRSAAKAREVLAVANEDVSIYPKVPWSTMLGLAGAVLVGVIGFMAWYVRRMTRHSRVDRREAGTFYLFLLPWIIGFVVLTFGSTVASLIFSFSRWDAINDARFVGLGNYAGLMGDPRFVKSLWNTLYYAAFTVPLAIVGGLAISVLMNQKVRGIRLLRTIYYLPVVVSGVATALMWQYLFNPKVGLINQVLVHFIDKPPAWLLDPMWAKPAFIIMSLWGIGGSMIIYLAGLQGIPEELYEASRLDGANSWQSFLNVTLPLLTPTIFYQLIIGTMASLQFFTQAYIMTGGGPEDSTMFYALYLFKNAFEWMKMGYASAMAWILFAIVLVVTLIQFKWANRWVYYEGRAE